MGEVVLLEAQMVNVSEARYICASCLEGVVGQEVAGIVEVVVPSEILVMVDPVIDTDSELVLIFGADGDALILITPDVGCGHELLQQIGSYRILALRWNDSCRKHRGPIGKTRRWIHCKGSDTTGRQTKRSVTSGAPVQNAGNESASLNAP